MSAITIKALQALLATLPQETIVVLAKDSEGNDFSPMQAEGGHSIGCYVAHRPWHGEFYDETSEDGGAPEGGVPALCLWPTN